jgi:hypothetical protein
MELSSGGQVLLRGFGRFNLTLWDQVIGELEPITADDIILVNFGAWYHRLYVDGGQNEWEAWRLDVQELLMRRLVHYQARIVWKGYTTFHYDGLTGAYTGVSCDMAGKHFQNAASWNRTLRVVRSATAAGGVPGPPAAPGDLPGHGGGRVLVR